MVVLVPFLSFVSVPFGSGQLLNEINTNCPTGSGGVKRKEFIELKPIRCDEIRNVSLEDTKAFSMEYKQPIIALSGNLSGKVIT
ncbi:MAG: hypothetical protein GY816_11670 [Cytophagales bacterium]|nr:hypothetical protein [Cytophagales bacterium]